MVDHIALVFGVIEAEGAAQVFGDVFRFSAVVTCLHMHGEAVPVTVQRQRLKGTNEGLCSPSFLFGLHYTCMLIESGAPAVIFLLAAGEEGAVFALEELFATVAVPVVSAQALHVSGTELAELTSENAVRPAVGHQRGAGCHA